MSDIDNSLSERVISLEARFEAHLDACSEDRARQAKTFDSFSKSITGQIERLNAAWDSRFAVFEETMTQAARNAMTASEHFRRTIDSLKTILAGSVITCLVGIILWLANRLWPLG